MAKKKEDTKGEKEIKDMASGVAVHITNNLRGPWIAPSSLFRLTSFAPQRVVYPMHGIEVDEGRFDHEMKCSKAFRFMIETGLLKKSKRIVKLDRRDLQSPELVEPPAHLQHQSKVDDNELKILNKAVTIDTKPNK